MRRDEKNIIAKLRGQTYHTDKAEWRKKQYYFFADTVITHFKMRRGLDFLLKMVIQKYKLKTIHPKLNYEKIILGIAIEILRRNKRLIPFSDKFVQTTHLKKDEQKVIRENLHYLGVFK